ncbi:MAG: TraR/DksA C4-type zinc finger protein [Planctomycetaceae bacterium]|nr:TraR/DksA C4-type zinc finger protein [Planctomycetaceae bacterium]
MKLTKAELKEYKNILLNLRARVSGDMSSLRDAAMSDQSLGAANSTIPSHIADAGSDAFDQDNTLRLIDNESVALNLIDEALDRVSNSTFGFCTNCNAKISKMRLQVLPYTPYCIKCANELDA